ncbi:MAG: hypothetical protein PHX08_09180 [Lachnospiraceae bacterium]|nr:hypothetical protein [Lachnospiraceae bacterium]
MEESGLEFDAETVQNQGDTYSSLTDINGVPVFTEEFTERIKTEQRGQAEKEKELSQEVFVEPMNRQKNSTDMLFMGTTQQVLKEEETTAHAENSLWYPLFGVWMLVFLAAMIWYCQRRNRKTEEKKKEVQKKYILQ